MEPHLPSPPPNRWPLCKWFWAIGIFVFLKANLLLSFLCFPFLLGWEWCFLGWYVKGNIYVYILGFETLETPQMWRGLWMKLHEKNVNTIGMKYWNVSIKHFLCKPMYPSGSNCFIIYLEMDLASTNQNIVLKLQSKSDEIELKSVQIWITRTLVEINFISSESIWNGVWKWTKI